jgi:hypothetical protein
VLCFPTHTFHSDINLQMTFCTALLFKS